MTSLATPKSGLLTTPSPSSFFGDTSLVRVGLDEVASTPPPSTPAPPSDPLDYEKSMYKDRVGEKDLSKLKEQVRILRGLPLTEDKSRRRIDSTKPPKMNVKPTLTSSKRKELQRHRLLVRCANLKDKYREYENTSKKDVKKIDELFRKLRSESMAKTVEEVDQEFDMEELESLKFLASKAKEREVVNFKETLGSQYRYKHNRGQPIISSNFRNAYDDYNKPPFTICKDIYRPKLHQLPKINKQNETWLVPVDDEEGIPLHRQMKSPDPNDKRSKREKERPPLKKGKRVTASEFGSDDSKEATKRPPWRGANFRACPLNFA